MNRVRRHVAPRARKNSARLTKTRREGWVVRQLLSWKQPLSQESGVGLPQAAARDSSVRTHPSAGVPKNEQRHAKGRCLVPRRRMGTPQSVQPLEPGRMRPRHITPRDYPEWRKLTAVIDRTVPSERCAAYRATGSSWTPWMSTSWRCGSGRHSAPSRIPRCSPPPVNCTDDLWRGQR